jgi:hypothetical protein
MQQTILKNIVWQEDGSLVNGALWLSTPKQNGKSSTAPEALEVTPSFSGVRVVWFYSHVKLYKFVTEKNKQIWKYKFNLTRRVWDNIG